MRFVRSLGQNDLLSYYYHTYYMKDLPTGGAFARRGMRVCKSDPLFSQPINIWSFDFPFGVIDF